MHYFKSNYGKTVSLRYILPQQQKLSQKRVKILQMITNIQLDLYFTMIYPSENFQ